MKNSLQFPDSSDDALAEQAAAWFLRMQEKDCSADERRAFEAWLAESETHRAEYRQYVALWHNLDHLGDVSKRSARKKYGAVAAVVAGLAVVFGALHWYINLGETITTAVGEHRHLLLADGTALDLNTASKIRVRLTDDLRKITLLRGEVMVRVAHEARPFEVHVGAGVLRDIGTTFDVSRESDNTTVAVLDGEVRVSLDGVAPVELHSGQQVAYSAREIFAVLPVNPADAGAWLGGRLIFRDTPLPEVVRQINRYHERPIKLADARMNDLKVSGEFNSADRAGLLDALKMLLSLNSFERGDVTELSR